MSAPEQSNQDLKRFLRLVIQKRYLFGIAAIVISAICIGASYLLPPVYEAESSVLIESNVLTNLIEGIAVTPNMEDKLRNLTVAIMGRDLLIRVIQDLKVPYQDEMHLERLVEHFRRKTNVTTNTTRSSLSLFTVAYQDKDARFATDYVNTLVKYYIEENLSGTKKEARDANRVLSEQISYFKEKIDTIDSQIAKYRKANGVYLTLDEAKILEDIGTAEKQLEEVGVTRMELKAKKELIREQMKNDDPNSQTSKLAALENKLKQLLMSYTEYYPEVLKVRSEIESLRKQMKGDPEADVTSASADVSVTNPAYLQHQEEMAKTDLKIAGLSTREAHLRGLIESKKRYLREVPGEKKQLIELERERDAHKKIYEELVYRLGKSEVSTRMDVQDGTEMFRIVDRAVLPTKPIGPDRKKFILIGLFAGLGGAFGLVFLLDYINPSIKSVDELRLPGLPVLAVIHAMETDKDVRSRRRKDAILVTFAGVYAVCVCGIFLMEFLGLI